MKQGVYSGTPATAIGLAPQQDDALTHVTVYLRDSDGSDVPIFVSVSYVAYSDARSTKGQAKVVRVARAIAESKARAVSSGLPSALVATLSVPVCSGSIAGISVSLPALATAASKAGLSTTQFDRPPLPACALHMYTHHFALIPVGVRHAIAEAVLRERDTVDRRTGVEVLYGA